MENMTKYLAYVLLYFSIFLDLITGNLLWQTPIINVLKNQNINDFIHDVISISFLASSGLFIWRGIYFQRKYGFRKRFFGELLLGLFLAAAVVYIMLLFKEVSDGFSQMVSRQMELTENLETNKFIAQNAYVTQGTILEYNGSRYQPTEEDRKQRQIVLDMHQNTKAITQGIYNWIALVVISVFLGLILPARKESLTKRSTPI